MARITVEDCLKMTDNRFGLVHLAAKRVRQLKKGVEPLVVCKNKDIVVALREIAAGEVFQTKGHMEHDMAEKQSEGQTVSDPEPAPLETDAEPTPLETGEEKEAPEEK